MLNGLGIPHGTDPDALISAYAISVHGVREDCVRDIAVRFVRGEVEISGYRKGRAPTTDIFGQACRQEQSARLAREQRDERLRLAAQRETKTRIYHTAENRAEMSENLRLLKLALSGSKTAQAALEPHWSKLKLAAIQKIRGRIIAEDISRPEFEAGCKERRWYAGARYDQFADVVYMPDGTS